MKARLTARILLIVLVLLVASLACISGGGGGGGGADPADITATFGAQQFHAQLTAQAQNGGLP